MESFTATFQGLIENHGDFQQKFKQRLVRESNNVINSAKFIAGLLTEGVLTDESTDSDSVKEFKEIIVLLAIKIASSQGAVGVGGLMKALEGSGNSQLVCVLRTWAKEDFGVEIYGDFSEPAEGSSNLPFPATKKLPKNVRGSTHLSSIGRKLLDNITSRVEDNVIDQLQGHLVGKISEIAHAAEFCITLAHHNVLEATDTLLQTGSKVQEENLIEKAIKAACSKKAIGSLVLALESSNNERILIETCDWLETTGARRKNFPISVKSLAKQQRPTATGLFAATTAGLISLDLQTLEATALTSESAFAVAVNHKLKKVYWTETGIRNASIRRSNFDGSYVEVIINPPADTIYALAIDEPSGNVYFSGFQSHEIRVCNAVGQNCATVISDPALVNRPVGGIAVDSVKGFLCWGNRPSSGPHSLVRAKLNGCNATILSTGFKDLHGLTLDQSSSDVLYWADSGENTFGTIDVNGGYKRILEKLDGKSGPWGIQVDAHKIYIGNWVGQSIQSVDRDFGAKLTTIFKSTDLARIDQCPIKIHLTLIFNGTECHCQVVWQLVDAEKQLAKEVIIVQEAKFYCSLNHEARKNNLYKVLARG